MNDVTENRLLKIIDSQSKSLTLLSRKCDAMQKTLDHHARLHEDHRKRLGALEKLTPAARHGGGEGPSAEQAEKIAALSRETMRNNIRKGVI